MGGGTRRIAGDSLYDFICEMRSDGATKNVDSEAGSETHSLLILPSPSFDDTIELIRSRPSTPPPPPNVTIELSLRRLSPPAVPDF